MIAILHWKDSLIGAVCRERESVYVCVCVGGGGGGCAMCNVAN